MRLLLLACSLLGLLTRHNAVFTSLAWQWSPAWFDQCKVVVMETQSNKRISHYVRSPTTSSSWAYLHRQLCDSSGRQAGPWGQVISILYKDVEWNLPLLLKHAHNDHWKNVEKPVFLFNNNNNNNSVAFLRPQRLYASCTCTKVELLTALYRQLNWSHQSVLRFPSDAVNTRFDRGLDT